MAGFSDGLSSGVNLVGSLRDQAWKGEQRAQQQKDWAREDETRQGLGSFIQKAMAPGENQNFDPRAAMGLGAEEPVQPVQPVDSQATYNSRQGFPGAVAPSPLAVQSSAKPQGLADQILPTSYAEAQRKLITQQFDVAKAIGGERGAMMAADSQKQLHLLKVKEDSAKIADTIQNLRPQDYEQLAKTVTADGGNKYEVTVDPATGLTTLKLGSAKAQLTRAQMGEYFAAKHRLKNGDFSAMADLEKVDAGLASGVAAEMKRLSETTNSSNKATYQQGLLDVREKAIESRERLGPGYSRDPEIAKTKNEIEAARNKRIDIQARIANLPKQVETRIMTRDAAKIELASLTAQQKQYDKIIDASESAPPGLATPLNAGEAGMRQQASGDMGVDPAAIQREITQTTADLLKVKDPASKAQLQNHLNELKRQSSNIGLSSQRAPTKPAPTSTASGRPPLSSFNR